MTSTNKPPVRPALRDRVYDVIDGERDYLDESDPAGGDVTPGEMLMTLEQMVRAAQMQWSTEPEGRVVTINNLRRIASVAVRALEKFGPVPRDWHVPASANIVAEMHMRDAGDALALTKPGAKNV